MRSHAAPSREDPLRRIHSTDIVGTRLDTTQYNPLAAPFPFDGVLGMKNDATSGCSWASWQTFAEQASFSMGFRFFLLIEDRAQKLIELIRLNAQQCFLFTDNAFADHVDGDTYGGKARALARARLKHPKLAVFDGELNILHISIVFLKKTANP